MMLKRHLKAIAAIGCMSFSSISYGDGWSYEIEPYGQFASIEGDAGIGRVTGAPLDVGFDDILEALEMAGMLHFEAHHENGWGVSLDYGFMELGADISGPRGSVVDATVRQGIFEALVLNRRQLSSGSLDYFAGVRWWDNDIDIQIVPAILPVDIEVSIKEDWVDVVVGVRWMMNINDRWQFMLKADVGGFGQEADFTSSVAAGVRYKMGERWSLDLQYRGLWVDYEDGTGGTPGYFAYDTVTHGPIVGFIYAF